MTRQRNDKHSTEFGLWWRNVAIDNKTILRNPDPITSSGGITVSNLDYMVLNWKTKRWFLCEEKRYNSELTSSQRRIIGTLASSIQNSNYRGFFLITFEKTNPKDGAMWLNSQKITEQDLIDFILDKKQYKPLGWTIDNYGHPMIDVS